MSDPAPTTLTDADSGDTARTSPWRVTILASLADYFDAGAIVASSAGLAVWAESYHLTSHNISILSAIGPNAIGSGVGALIGGVLGDSIGRKRIYQYDLLFYMFATLFFIFAAGPWMLIAGSALIGLAVGVDIPTSWVLVGEAAPNRSRARYISTTTLFWVLGAAVTLLLAFAFSSLGFLGIRLLFVVLLVVAFVTWYLRQGMAESVTWTAAKKEERMTGRTIPVVTARTLKRLLFLFGVYVVWTLVAGTNGFFLPYILRNFGGEGQGTSVLVASLGFITQFVAILLFYWPFCDRSDNVRRLMFGVGGCAQIFAYLLFALFPVSLGTALANVLLWGWGVGVSHTFTRTWSVELFPTLRRTTSQSIMYGTARILLGIWSFYVPIMAHLSLHNLAWVLVAFLTVATLVGVVWTPRTTGKAMGDA